MQMVLPRPQRTLMNPLELPNLAAWYDLALPASTTSNDIRIDGSNRVSLVADKSGNSATNCLCCNGGLTNRATATLTGQNLGTSDWSLSLTVKYLTGGIFNGFAQISPSASSGESQGRSLNVNFSNSDAFRVYLYGATTSDFIMATISGIHSTYAGQRLHICVTQSAGTLKIWLNGVDTAFSTSTGGSAPSWNSGITSSFLGLAHNSITNVLVGSMYNAALYNKALSAAEVAALYAANGAPAQADRWGTMTGPVAGCIAYYDFSAASKLATTVSDLSSNSLTLTINSSGEYGARISGERDYANLVAANQPIYSSSSRSITGNGTTQSLRTPRFSLAQPYVRYTVIKQVSWASGDYLLDGANGANSSAVIQTTATPQLNLNAGSSVAANTDLAVGTLSLLIQDFNGASSALAVGSGTATTGNAGSTAANGLTLLASGASTAANHGNGEVCEDMVFTGTHDATTKARLRAYFRAKWGISV